MKLRLKVPSGRPLADFIPTLTIKAKDFANEHVDNNVAVRKMLMERWVKPKNLPPAEDAKKIQRRLDGDGKSLSKGTRKKK